MEKEEIEGKMRESLTNELWFPKSRDSKWRDRFESEEISSSEL
jgi:hypothetical protein